MRTNKTPRTNEKKPFCGLINDHISSCNANKRNQISFEHTNSFCCVTIFRFVCSRKPPFHCDIRLLYRIFASLIKWTELKELLPELIAKKTLSKMIILGINVHLESNWANSNRLYRWRTNRISEGFALRISIFCHLAHSSSGIVFFFDVIINWIDRTKDHFFLPSFIKFLFFKWRKS